MDTGWQVLSLEHVAGRAEPWLFVIARTGQAPSSRLGVPSDDPAVGRGSGGGVDVAVQAQRAVREFVGWLAGEAVGAQRVKPVHGWRRSGH